MILGRPAARLPRPAVGLCAAAVALSTACRERRDDGAAAADASSGVPIAVGPPQRSAEPRPGMAFVPGGALVAGTPLELLPRIADQEMAGEQLILRGFYMDVYPYPNEAGAIPLTNVTQAEAAALCAERGKRLCSELEWERACKGPDNQTYEYGPTVRPERCKLGKSAQLRPSGLVVGCRSDFGVHDLHGGIWEWTGSRWGRGSQDASKVAIRGGSGPEADVYGRCAHAAARKAESKSATIGFRCCAGERNEAEVVVPLDRGKPLEQRPFDADLAGKIVAHLPVSAAELGTTKSFKADRLWIWRPIANEELMVVGGCSKRGKDPSCGVLVARLLLGRPTVIATASSGIFAPVAKMEADAARLWIYGGDATGRFRSPIGYRFGRAEVGAKERKLPKQAPRRRKRRR